MPKPKTGRGPRKKEARFTASDEERARIERAAEARKLRPATFMRRLVLGEVDRVLADAGAAAAVPSSASSASDERIDIMMQGLADMATVIAELQRKLVTREKS